MEELCKTQFEIFEISTQLMRKQIEHFSALFLHQENHTLAQKLKNCDVQRGQTRTG